jgi:hypothetical protein
MNNAYIHNPGLHYSTHSQFTGAYALGFSVFTSRILATDWSWSHCKFESHMKSSLHCLFLFMSLFCDCQFQRLNSIQFLCTQAHIPAGWCLEARPFTSNYRLLCFYYFHYFSVESQSHGQSYFTISGLLPISSSWCQSPWDPRPDIFSNWTPAIIVLV